MEEWDTRTKVTPLVEAALAVLAGHVVALVQFENWGEWLGPVSHLGNAPSWLARAGFVLGELASHPARFVWWWFLFVWPFVGRLAVERVLPPSRLGAHASRLAGLGVATAGLSAHFSEAMFYGGTQIDSGLMALVALIAVPASFFAATACLLAAWWIHRR
ncbi:MAG: hypothetical protein JNG84_12895 [Archangium sp.]|nr:hypothetical protein [Archangium sp.]